MNANFIVRVLTLKGLETDTLYLVFKYRVPNCIWIALQTTQTPPNQTGILTNDLNPVTPTLPDSPDLSYFKKRRNLLATCAEEATLKVVSNSLFSNPLMPLKKRNGHYRDKNLLVNTFVAHNQFFICLREAHVFKGEKLDASNPLGLPKFSTASFPQIFVLLV